MGDGSHDLSSTFHQGDSRRDATNENEADNKNHRQAPNRASTPGPDPDDVPGLEHEEMRPGPTLYRSDRAPDDRHTRVSECLHAVRAGDVHPVGSPDASSAARHNQGAGEVAPA